MPRLWCPAPDLPAWPTDRLGTGPAALARGAQQRMGAGEQAPRLTLRPAWLHHPVAAAERMHLPGCKTPRSPILKTASKQTVRAVAAVVLLRFQDRPVRPLGASPMIYIPPSGLPLCEPFVTSPPTSEERR